MKKIFTAVLLALSLSAFAGDVYKVVRSESAFVVETQIVRVCGYTGSHSIPMCEDIEQKIKVQATGYNVIIVKEGTDKEKYFHSAQAFNSGTMIRLTETE